MEQPPPPSPDPAAVTHQQPDLPTTAITSRPNDDPRWATPHPRDVGRSSSMPLLVMTSICLLGLCLLGALVGSWVLVMVGGVAALLVFHYLVWGWLYTRMVAAQQKEELLKLAARDADLLPDPQRWRHM